MTMESCKSPPPPEDRSSSPRLLLTLTFVLLISHSVFLHWKVKGVEEQLALFTSVLDNQDVSSSNKSRFDSQLLTPLLRRKRADLDGNEIGSSSSSSSSLCSCPSGNKLIQEMIHYKQMRMYSIYYIKCIYRAFMECPVHNNQLIASH
jgi:hypothetical protein